MTLSWREQWIRLISSAGAAVVIGFASTILVVMEGAKAMGANPAQQASAAAALCFAMAATSLYLAVRYRQPAITAWSTPGAALLASSDAVITYPEAIGAFLFAGALTVLTGFLTPLSSAINKLPASIAGAMLAGVLLRFVIGVPAAGLAEPALVVPLIIAFFALRMFVPVFTVPVVVGLGMLFAVLAGAFQEPATMGLTMLTFDLPQFSVQALIGIGLPLYLVTMASQNLPGFAVLKAHGYEPHVRPSLVVTGVGSIAASFSGGLAVNMAAITAAIAAGPDSHDDAKQRWKIIFPYTILYVFVGLAAGTFVAYLGALPPPLITAVAGLALFAPLMGGISTMMKTPQHTEAALVTFLVTASGFSMFGIGAAFWGLLTGLILWAAQGHWRGSHT
jgi:benzoate membrane transport protein